MTIPKTLFRTFLLKKSAIKVFHTNLDILPYLLFFCILSLDIKVKMCRIDTLFSFYLENIKYCITEFNMAQKL